MPDNPRVIDLLDRIAESDATPEDVCYSCPELLSQVRTRWEEMRRAEAELDALFPATDETRPATEAVDATLPEIPGYEISSVLGVGGMGVVFSARHLRLNRVVALKMGLAGAYAGPTERERFQREAEAVAALRHPNIVQIFDIGDADGRSYFTMEYVDGGSLAQTLDGAPRPPRQAAELVMTLAAAVDDAHQNGIIHRDIKPANILLTRDGVPKISDFGLARRLDGEQHLTRTGAALGTPCYMAPEQAEGRRDAAGPGADVYSLGAILYELLTGRPPFRGETPIDTVHQLLNEDPVSPSRLNAKTPRDLETISLKCLNKDAALRYQSCSALADDLRRFLQGEPITARPVSMATRFLRRVHRRPALAGAIALALISTIALIGGGLWLLSDRTATQRAAAGDLKDMMQSLKDSRWAAAAAARDRAKGRLGASAPAELRLLIDEGTRNLEIALRLDDIRYEVATIVDGVSSYRNTEQAYANMFRDAGFGTMDDAPELAAARIASSPIRNALVIALDHWSTCTKDERRRGWILSTASRADPDPGGWRVQARDPGVRGNQAALRKLMATAPVDDPSVSLLLVLEMSLPYAPTDERIGYLRRVQQAHPDDLWANLRLGFVAATLRRPGEALAYYQAALALRPDSALIHNNIGRMLADLGRRDEALFQFEKAVQLDPTAADVHVHFAFELGRKGRIDEAVAHLRETLGKIPQAAVLYSALAQCLDAQGHADEALAQFKKAVAVDPAHDGAQQGLRAFFLKRGRTEEALAAWRRALDVNPPLHEAWYGYAELALFLGKEDEYRWARKAMLDKFNGTRDPVIAERTARASLLLPASGGELQRAVALTEIAAVTDHPDYRTYRPYFQFVKGLADYRQGRYEQASNALQKAAQGMTGPSPRLVLAMTLYKTGREGEAREKLAEAIKSHDWQQTKIRDQDGWIAHVLRREAEATISRAP